MDLVYKQIGDAVPVRLILVVAELIAEWVEEQLGSKLNENGGFEHAELETMNQNMV